MQQERILNPLKSPGHTDEFGIFYHIQCSVFTEHKNSCL